MSPTLKHTAAANVTVNLKAAAALVLTWHPQRVAVVIVPLSLSFLPIREGAPNRASRRPGEAGGGGCWEVELPKEVWERCC